jgi:hypothetical protein
VPEKKSLNSRKLKPQYLRDVQIDIPVHTHTHTHTKPSANYQQPALNFAYQNTTYSNRKSEIRNRKIGK